LDDRLAHGAAAWSVDPLGKPHTDTGGDRQDYDKYC